MTGTRTLTTILINSDQQMNKTLLPYLTVLLVFVTASNALAQREHDERPTIENFKGIQYTGDDSTFYINFRFRMPSRLNYTSFGGDGLGSESLEARIRRLRLRMDGYLYNPNFSYNIPLGLSLSEPRPEEHRVEKKGE